MTKIRREFRISQVMNILHVSGTNANISIQKFTLFNLKVGRAGGKNLKFDGHTVITKKKL